MSDVGSGQTVRCAVHPSRRAAGPCPVCDRPRCGADVATYADHGCAACISAAVPTPRPPIRERLLRGALASLAVAFAGGWVAAQYVDTQWFSLIAPALVGLTCAGAGAAAAGAPRVRAVLVSSALAGVLGTALSDRLVPGGQNLFLPASHRVPPYLAAVIGAVAWPVLFPPGKS
jgi:hypothetical protein